MSNVIAEVGEFFTGWTTYRKVLDNNYRFHKEIYQVVNSVLHEKLATQPFSLLDSDCGEERSALAHHIRNNDLAETADTLHTLAKTAGFNTVIDVCQYPWHGVFVFHA